MTLQVSVENVSGEPDIPETTCFTNWAIAAHSASGQTSAKPLLLDIRVVGEEESAEYNQQYRQKPHATNVLSFPSALPEAMTETLAELPLGDLLICAQVVNREATEQQKETMAHWAHMVIHGVLHLCGYDHENDADAAVMESLERDILLSLNYNAPYSAE